MEPLGFALYSPSNPLRITVTPQIKKTNDGILRLTNSTAMSQKWKLQSLALMQTHTHNIPKPDSSRQKAWL